MIITVALFVFNMISNDGNEDEKQEDDFDQRTKWLIQSSYKAL